MLVCCLLEQRLHLATTYQADNDADRLYYIMGVWKSLKMDEKTQALYLNNASQELLAQAKRFILNTTVCEL
jgi:hypothetical protein